MHDNQNQRREVYENFVLMKDRMNAAAYDFLHAVSRLEEEGERLKSDDCFSSEERQHFCKIAEASKKLYNVVGDDYRNTIREELKAIRECIKP